MSQYMAPGVYTRVNNISQIATLAASSIFGFVGQAPRGPKGLYYSPSAKALTNRFGFPDAEVNIPLYGAYEIGKVGAGCWFNNITDGTDTTAFAVHDLVSKTGVQKAPVFDPKTYVFSASSDSLKEAFVVSANGPGPAYTDVGYMIGQAYDDGSFDLQVFQISSPASPLETFRVSLSKSLNGGGKQQFIEDIINGNSNFIVVRANPAYVNSNPNTVPDPSTSIIPLWAAPAAVPSLGGVIDNSDVIKGWQVYTNAKKIDVNMLVDAGFATKEVHVEMIAIAQKRGDAEAILDFPVGVRTPEARVAYRKTLAQFNRFGSLWGPRYQIYSTFNDKNVYMPMSIGYASAIAISNKNNPVWFAVAGARRGTIPNALNLEDEFEQADMELMYPQSVNCVVNEPGIGIIADGNRTLLQDNSSLWSLNVHRCVNVVLKSCASFLKYYQYEQNDDVLGRAIETTLDQFLESVVADRGLYRFKVVSDSTNNTPQDIDELTRNVDIYLQPTRAAEIIVLTATITRTGASFDINATSGSL